MPHEPYGDPIEATRAVREQVDGNAACGRAGDDTLARALEPV